MISRFRVFKDFDLTQPVATVTPKQLNPSLINIERLDWAYSKDISVYDESSAIQFAFTAYSGYKVSGINATNAALQDADGNTIPLERFTRYEVTDGAELYDDSKRQTIYTEGKTRFYLYYGETATHVLIWIGPAAIYTDGPGADLDGFVSVPIPYASNYSGFVANSYGVPAFIAIDKTTYRTQPETIKIRFLSGAVKFPSQTTAEQVFLSVVTAEPVNATPGEERDFDIMGVINLYSSNVFEGIENYEESYTPTTNNVTRGGTGTGYYPHSAPEGANFSQMVTERNNALANTMGTGKGLSWYKMTQTGFAGSLAFAYGHDTLLGSVSADKRISAYVGAYMLPVTVTGTNSPFWLADDARNFGSDCQIIGTRLVYGDCGTIDLSSYGWDDFNDFENTRATLFLPFVGTVNIDMNAIARGAITVKYIVDVCNGNIAFWVYTNSMQSAGTVLYGVYTGNCAVEIPTAGTYKGNVLDKIINAGTSIASGDYAGIARVAVDAITDVHVNKAGGIDTNSASISRYQPRLDIEKKEILRVDQYAEITGIPAFVTKNLNTLQGFVQVHSVDLTGITGEESDKAEIESLLKEGVYL